MGAPAVRRPEERDEISRYDVRYSPIPITEGDDSNATSSFIQALPALAATDASVALSVPTDGAPGSQVAVDFGGLSAATEYWVAVRAIDICNSAGPPTWSPP